MNDLALQVWRTWQNKDYIDDLGYQERRVARINEIDYTIVHLRGSNFVITFVQGPYDEYPVVDSFPIARLEAWLHNHI